MSNFRQIHVSIWKDTWFLDLEPDEKLLFIYLFSNESTSLAGIYKISPKVIAFETGINMQRMTAIMAKFARDGKVFQQGDVVWTVNMRKFHETRSSKVNIRIQNDIDLIPDSDIKRKYIAYYDPKLQYPYPMDRVSALYEYEDKDKHEDTQEDEEEETEEDDFTRMQRLFETIVGLPALPSDMNAINECIKLDVTEQDIRDALKWRMDNGVKAVKTIGQLIPGCITNRNMRVQRNGASVSKPASEKYKLPDDYNDDTDTGTDIDDKPEVNPMWDMFVQQYVKDRRWQNLLEYGGMDDNGKVLIRVPEKVLPEAIERFGKTLSNYYMGKAILEGTSA
jgi:hypothetical protein